MRVALRQIAGPWADGWVLDKHSVSSTYTGDDAQGRAQFDTVRTEAGEATYRLKYRQQWDQAGPLARALADHIYPKFDRVGFIVPMPASKRRYRQPVTAVALELGKIVKVPVLTDLLRKQHRGGALKDLQSKSEKTAALRGSFSINDRIRQQGPWNALLIDDLYATGASMEAACRSLHTYRKIRSVYVASMTWS